MTYQGTFPAGAAADSDELRALRAAARCQAALAAFLFLEPTDRAGLAHWLLRQYAPLTVRSLQRAVDLPDGAVCASWPLDVIVEEAQRALTRIVDEPALFDEAVATAVLRGQVRQIAGAWCPVDRRRQTLIERVTSLVAALFLNGDAQSSEVRASFPPSSRQPVFPSGIVKSCGGAGDDTDTSGRDPPPWRPVTGRVPRGSSGA